MSRHKATGDDRRRAKQLGDSLKKEKDEQEMTVQALSTRSNLPYETVRSLLAGKAVGPSFFLVADLAEALGKHLDDLAKEAR